MRKAKRKFYSRFFLRPIWHDMWNPDISWIVGYHVAPKSYPGG